MIKNLLFCVIGIVALSVYLTPKQFHAASSTSGSPAGFSGSPGDGGQTCRFCHGPGSAPLKDNVLTGDIPETGYIPGATYNMSITFTETGRSKFGFELTSENSANAKRGQFIAGNSAVRTLSSSTRLTHTTAGTTAIGGSKTWNFSWKAPATGTGTITFYGTINASNSNGNDDSGDNIYTFRKTVNENTGNSVAEYISQLDTEIGIYPNPAVDIITITIPKHQVSPEQVDIYALDGKKISRLEVVNNTVNVSWLPAGQYLLSTSSSTQKSIRFIKQ